MAHAHANGEEITRVETVDTWKLWIGLLVGPLVWITHLVAGYSTEEWFACSPSTTTPGELLGMSVDLFIIIITVGAAAITVWAGLTALSCRRKLTADDEGSSRPLWMATVGVMNSALYLVLILGGTAPALLLTVCEKSP